MLLNASTYKLITSIEPESFTRKLSQNSPNPFSDFTLINHRLIKSWNVLLSSKNLFRQDKFILVNEQQMSGNQSVDFINQTLNSGIYVYVLDTEDGVLSRKMVVVRW